MSHDPLRTTVSDHEGLDPFEMLLRLDPAQKEVQSGNELQLTLQRLLIDFGVTVSSDPRDSIYAFVSLANDIDVSNWAPDYSQINPPLNLFIKVLAQMVDRTGSIDAICRHRSWSHPSIPNSVSWLPWFGSVAAGCRSGHTHLIHYYHDKSVTTFHRPWKESRYTCPCCDRIREFSPHRRRLCCQCCGKVLPSDRYDCAKCPRSGYCSSCAISGRAASTHAETWIHSPELRSRTSLPRVVCDGCDVTILGTGLTCVNCDHFDYCLKCVRTAQPAHDPSHRFEFHDEAIYFASGRSLTSFNGRSLEAVACQLFQRVPGDVLGQYTMPQHFHIGIGFSGFIVDKIRAVGVESPSAMPHDVNIPKDSVGPKFSAHPDINLQQWATLRPQIPIQDWAKLPGMKALTLDENGMPGRMFYRALTGNRRKLGGKIGHLTDEMIEQARVYYNSEEPDKRCAWNVHESVEVMLQNKRKFATTNTSLGFVPTDAQVGDSIAILEGCSVPVVIREGHHRPRPDFVTWQLIGECYIEGLMEGEFIEKLASQNEVWSEKLTII